MPDWDADGWGTQGGRSALEARLFLGPSLTLVSASASAWVGTWGCWLASSNCLLVCKARAASAAHPGTCPASQQACTPSSWAAENLPGGLKRKQTVYP